MIELPKKVSKAEYETPRYMFVYSPHKTGKTDICSSITRNYWNMEKNIPLGIVIDIEDGSQTFDGVRITIPNQLTVWKKIAMFFEIMETIQKEGCPYMFGIVDSATELEYLAEWYATQLYMQSPQGITYNCWTNEDCDKKRCKPLQVGERKPVDKWETVLNLGNGYGYRWLRDAFAIMWDKIRATFPRVIFIGHIKEKFEEKKGELIATTDIDLTGKIKFTVARKVDVLALLVVKENERWLSFKTNDNNGAAGTRCKYLRDKQILISKLDNDILEYYWDEIYPDLKHFKIKK